MENNSLSPLISCLCVTFKRPQFLARSVACFLDQTYPNKELIILHSAKDLETVTALRTLSHPGIRPYAIDDYENILLGDIRNKSTSLAQGKYVCIWDDDDWYHPKRLELQLSRTLEANKAGSILSNVVIYDVVTQKAYFSTARPWEFSLFCEKELFSDRRFRYASLNKGEDTPLVTQLIAYNKLVPIVAPPVYIYSFHGGNTCSYQHFKFLFDLSQELSAIVNPKIKGVLEGNVNAEDKINLFTDHHFLQSIDYYYYLRFEENFPKAEDHQPVLKTENA